MNARPLARVVVLAISLAAVFPLAGCQSHSQNQSNPPLEAHAPAGPSSAPNVSAQQSSSSSQANNEPAPGGLPDALAQKTAAYARNLEPADQPAAVRRAKQPSPVQWEDPHKPTAAANDHAELAATPPSAAAAKPSPSPSASSDAHPAAAVVQPGDDHAAAIARSAKANALNDIPAIVPESSDFASAGSPANSDPLEQQLIKRAHDNPRDIASQLDCELFEMLRDEASPQLASLASLPNEDKEVVAAVVDGLTNFRTGVRQDNNMLLSKKIRPLMDMADRLRSHAELSVPTVALCKRVDGFGKYEPIDPPRFPAGKDNPVIVYCEIQNFESQLNERRLWQTRLTQQVTLFTETGMLVWNDKSRPVADECRNRRHDFFLYNVVKLPANLTIGRYLLKVSIEDRTAHRVAESTVPVEIVGQQ
ncbi:MAG TPA: hypothetical protein VLI90_05350 [Tepidisphaeraceae bacterium]|nr:hypothetical protein [Tepidisphaeraceae bacterium]